MATYIKPSVLLDIDVHTYAVLSFEIYGWPAGETAGYC